MDEASFEDANMIGDLTSVQVLLPAYANASSIAFTHGIQYLQSKYNMRKIRGIYRTTISSHFPSNI